MALIKKRKVLEDELIWPDNIGEDWKTLFQSGK